MDIIRIEDVRISSKNLIKKIKNNQNLFIKVQ